MRADFFDCSVVEAELGWGPASPSAALLVEQRTAGSLAWLPLRLVRALRALIGLTGPDQPRVGPPPPPMGPGAVFAFSPAWASALLPSYTLGVLVSSSAVAMATATEMSSRSDP